MMTSAEGKNTRKEIVWDKEDKGMYLYYSVDMKYYSRKNSSLIKIKSGK